MKYLFKCIKCSEQEERDIPMAYYDDQKDKQCCSKCNSKMERVIQFDGAVGLCSGMYGTGKNGWNN